MCISTNRRRNKTKNGRKNRLSRAFGHSQHCDRKIKCRFVAKLSKWHFAACDFCFFVVIYYYGHIGTWINRFNTHLICLDSISNSNVFSVQCSVWLPMAKMVKIVNCFHFGFCSSRWIHFHKKKKRRKIFSFPFVWVYASKWRILFRINNKMERKVSYWTKRHYWFVCNSVSDHWHIKFNVRL